MPSSWRSDMCSRSEEHTSELQSHSHLVCRLLLEKKNLGLEEIGRRSAEVLLEPMTGRASLGVWLRRPLTTGDLGVEEMGRRSAELFFFFNNRATPEIYPLSLHDPLPI